MGGLNIQRFVGRNVGANSFAKAAVSGQLTPYQMVSIEVALEQADSASARDLADLLARVRTGQFTTSEALANAERTIKALAMNARLFEEDAVVVARLEGALARRDASNPFYSKELGMCLLPDQLFTEGQIVSGTPAYVGDAGHSEPPATDRVDHGYRMSAVTDSVAATSTAATSHLITGAALAALAQTGFARVQNQMLSIPGGAFQMGYDGPDAFEDEGPAHKVTVSPFQMQQNDVTNAQYKTWVDSLGKNRFFLVRLDERGWPQVMAMGAEGAVAEYKSKIKVGDIARMMGEETADLLEFGALQTFVDANFQIWEAERSKPYSNFDKPNQPANVTWKSAYLYAFMHGSRLPTRAEFEFAASEGGTRTTYDPTQIHTSHQTQQTTTAEINNSRPVNGPYGLSDIMGNVLKWLMDWHGPYSAEEQADPTGASTGNFRELGGASWSNFDARNLRVSPRYNFLHPLNRLNFIGFRLVRQDSRE